MTSTLNGHVQRTAATEVAERLGAAGVKYAAISFVDMHGKPKAKMVPLNHLGQAARGSSASSNRFTPSTSASDML